MKIMKNLKR